MAEEFQSGVCGGGTWWMNSPTISLSPCTDFGWSSSTTDHHMVNTTTTRSCEESNNSVSAAQQQQQTDSDSGGSSTGILMDSTLQVMSFGHGGLSSSTNSSSTTTTTDWNQTLLRGGNGIQEDITSSENGFPSSYAYPSYTLLQSFFEPENTQQQQSLFHNGCSTGRSMNNNNYMSSSSPINYGGGVVVTNSNDQLWSKAAPMLKQPSLPKQQQPSSLHFSNNAPFWNASANFFTSSPSSQFLSPALEEKTTTCRPVLTSKSNTIKKASSELPAFKRPRIETPSPLPTFKVRKEKLGDRITALQQLVSPFGKTDTASVLHEAIEYIKFLHDQVSVLSTPYMKQGTPIIQQQQNSDDKMKDQEGAKQDLRSRGLCLVPISSTFPVANETTADFWTPTFGGTYR